MFQSCLVLVLGLGRGVWFVLKNLDLGGRLNPRVLGTSVAPPPEKSPKTIEKLKFRALEPPGTSPEHSETAQDHLKACSSHPSAAQDRPVRPPRRSVRPPRRHVVRPGSSSVCPGSNSVCLGNSKIIEIPLKKQYFFAFKRFTKIASIFALSTRFHNIC